MRNMETRIKQLEMKSPQSRNSMSIPLWQIEREELEGILEKAAVGEKLTPQEQERVDREYERVANVLSILHEVGALPPPAEFERQLRQGLSLTEIMRVGNETSQNPA